MCERVCMCMCVCVRAHSCICVSVCVHGCALMCGRVFLWVDARLLLLLLQGGGGWGWLGISMTNCSLPVYVFMAGNAERSDDSQLLN